jgi:hypothetical protein
VVDRAVDSLQVVARELSPFGGDESKTRTSRATPAAKFWRAMLLEHFASPGNTAAM